MEQGTWRCPQVGWISHVARGSGRLTLSTRRDLKEYGFPQERACFSRNQPEMFSIFVRGSEKYLPRPRPLTWKWEGKTVYKNRSAPKAQTWGHGAEWALSPLMSDAKKKEPPGWNSFGVSLRLISVSMQPLLFHGWFCMDPIIFC